MGQLPNPGRVSVLLANGENFRIQWRRLPDRYIEYQMQLPNGSKQKWTYTMMMVDQDIAILVGIGGAIENYPGIFEKLGMLPTTIQELMWLSAQPDVSP